MTSIEQSINVILNGIRLEEKVFEYCDYCLRENRDETNNLISVFIRDGLHSWQGPILICKQCKKYLRGGFKYAEK